MREVRILIVEDDSIVAELFSELLTSNDYVPVISKNAEQAIQLLEQESFELVICDKNLPGLNGLDLLAWIKDRMPDLDVIIMTAYADMDSMLSALRRGVYDYLVKPFPSLDEVLQKIERALDKRRMRVENRRLVRDLLEANARIETMNRNLEGEVAERTRQLQDANRKLEELTWTDDVTALYNQRFLYRRLDEEFRRVRRYHSGLAVIMLDIDNFKEVNDTHDHLFGSRVLKRVGEVLKISVRSVDLCIRYGGDEFVIVLPHTGFAEALQVAERVRASIEAADVGDDGEIYHVTASVGMAMLSSCNADSPKSLVRAADKALYAAKRGGRNRVFAISESSAAEAG